MERMSKIIDSHFLIKIIKNEAAEEDKILFEKWLNESDENKEEFGTLVLLWKKVGDSKLPPLPDQFLQWEKIRAELAQNANPVKQEESSNDSPHLVKPEQKHFDLKQKEKREYAWVLKVAAVLIIFVSVPFLLFINKNQNLSKQIKPDVKSQSEIMYSVEAEKGVRKTILLPDESLVYLNVDSKLIYPEKFSDTNRIVELEGEAYFNVSHDASRPFKVICGNTVTVVKGTEFNIKSRNDEVEIILTKGSVETFKKDSNIGIQLKKGEVITFDERMGFSKPIKANINHYLAWRKGKFSFSHTSLENVMDEIGRYYNVDVVFRNPSERSKIITGVFDADSLEHIFSIIGLTLDVKIELNGSKVIVQ
ncbi:MAG: FecR domain-containing protein [Ignavibacteriaceae bacterium]|jgi:ferric-dicitrate binding protein FerR (iron transport regulator)